MISAIWGSSYRCGFYLAVHFIIILVPISFGTMEKGGSASWRTADSPVKGSRVACSALVATRRAAVDF